MEQVLKPCAFNEDKWIRLIFQLRDTQHWLNELSCRAILQLPKSDRKKLFRKKYYISVTALAHIIERHYHKIPRHPEAGKFTIPIALLLCYLRQASTEPATEVPGQRTWRRVLNTGAVIGYNRDRVHTTCITVITDYGGKIITAFPGTSAPDNNPLTIQP